jgi:hypothetical protein
MNPEINTYCLDCTTHVKLYLSLAWGNLCKIIYLKKCIFPFQDMLSRSTGSKLFPGSYETFLSHFLHRVYMYETWVVMILTKTPKKMLTGF